MELKNRNPKIIVIAGKARSGKNTIANIFKDLFVNDNKKVIISPYTKYLKGYIKDIVGTYDEDNKPRDLLQQFGVEIIKQELKKDTLFIDRQLDDIDIYSYFFDVILIPDARFPKEIEVLTEKYKNVVSIKVITTRDNYMTEKEKNHITEISLDNYDNFDYVITNNNQEDLNIIVEDIYDKLRSD